MEKHKKRSKCEVTVNDVREILRKSGLGNGVVRSKFSGLDEETFCRTHEYLMREILQATPRLNAPVLQSAILQEFGQGVDAKANRDFAEAIVNAFRFVHEKKGHMTSGKKSSHFLKGFLRSVWPSDDVAEHVAIMDRSAGSSSAPAALAIQDEGPSGPSSSTAIVLFADSPAKVAKPSEDMSPGSILAAYGVDRSHVIRRTLTRNVSEQVVSDDDDDSEHAEAAASDAHVHSTIHQVTI